jgi:hypothetical protein
VLRREPHGGGGLLPHHGELLCSVRRRECSRKGERERELEGKVGVVVYGMETVVGWSLR